MVGVIDTARGILAALQPQTGERATGSILATATSSDVVVPRNAVLIPVLNGQTRPELIIKTDKGTHSPTGCNKYSWLVSSAGTSINVLSNIGGARHNLPATTVLRWDPPIAGLAATATVQAPGLAGGSDPTFFGGLKSGVVYEEFGGPQPSLELFRSRVGHLPALLVIWDGSEPADGAGTDQLSRGSSRAARETILYREKYLILVFTNRKDSDAQRRAEGLEALDGVSEWLTDRQGADGMPISSPSGLQIRERFRLSGDSLIYREHYVYGLRVSAVRALTKRDARTYHDWLQTRIDWVIGQTNDPTDLEFKPVVTNQLVPMLQGAFSNAFNSNAFD